MWKKTCVIATLAAAAALGSACSSDKASHPDANGPVTISIESYLPALGANGTDTLKGLIRGFEAANPTITVKTVADASTATSSLSAVYQREAATNSLPDVGQVTFDSLRFAVESLGARDLDKTYGSNAVNAVFGGAAPYSPPVRKLAVVNGATYGVPWTLSTPVLFYNPTLFKQAGLDPAKAPATWDEVATDAAAIKAKTSATGITVGCVGQASGGSDWCLQSILYSNGGSVLNKDASKTTFDSPANVAAISELHRIAASGGMADLTIAQQVQEFSTGKLAMVLNTSALQASLLTAVGSSFQMQNGPMPAFAGRAAVPTNSGSTLMVFTKDEAKQAAAWKLIQYLTSPQSETTITEKVGYPPLRTSLVDDPKYLKAYAQKEPLIAANIAQLGKVAPWQSYPGSNFLQIETLISDAVTKAVFQNTDVSKALKGAQSQAAGLVQ